MADEEVRATYGAAIASQASGGQHEAGLAHGQRPVEGDCPVCMMELVLGAVSKLERVCYY